MHIQELAVGFSLLNVVNAALILGVGSRDTTDTWLLEKKKAFVGTRCNKPRLHYSI